MTVLARRTNDAARLASLLSEAKIPCDVVTADPSTTPGVERFLAWLTLALLDDRRDLALWWYFLGDPLRPRCSRRFGTSTEPRLPT